MLPLLLVSLRVLSENLYYFPFILTIIIGVGLESVLKLFADNTSMYLCLENDDMRADILNSDLDKIRAWAFNCQKTELLDICRQQNVLLPPLYFEDAHLIDVENHKHLSVILQGNCK
eukprot:GHVL01024979.1.p1 GENE.GHVL01024979.1~~GHVL01024979.1.p1  ORF type:complete len:117 (+),score=8.25 GHVL01024979.1:124-474(+)